jgi:hypothetical protein
MRLRPRQRARATASNALEYVRENTLCRRRVCGEVDLSESAVDLTAALHAARGVRLDGAALGVR